MGIGQLPTKTDGTSAGEIGRAVIDRPRPFDADPRYDIEAAKHERLKDQVIENATAIGTTVAPAAGSLEARLAALEASPGAPSLDVGALLWEWNGLDLTEFETACRDYEIDLGSVGGGDADTTCIPTVVADPLSYVGGNLLRLTYTTMVGCAFLAVRTTSVVLPSRYVIDVMLREQTGSFHEFGAMVYANDDGADAMQGLEVSRTFNLGNALVRPVVNNRFTGGSESLASSGNFLTAVRDRGGVRMRTTVHKRPAGEATATALVEVLDQARGGNSGPYKEDTALPHTVAGVGANWDTIDMDRFGIFVTQSTNGNSGVADFKHLRIYAHPDD